MDVSEEEICKFYFATHKAPEDELADEELDNFAGGSCYSSDGRMVV